VRRVTIAYRGLLGDVLDERQKAAQERIRKMSAEELSAQSPDVLLDVELAKVLFEPLVFDFDGLSASGPPVQRQVDIRNAFRERVRAEGLVYTVRVPFTGSPVLIDHTPHGGSGIQNGVPLLGAVVDDSAVVLTIETVGLNPDETQRQVRQAINFARSWLEQQATYANGYLELWSNSARDKLRDFIALRSAALQSGESVLKSLGIAIMRTENPIPLRRKPSALRLSPSTIVPANSDAQDYHLELAIYRDIVSTIDSLGKAVERTPVTHEKLGEEDLRNVILFVLNANYRGQVVGEAFSGAGKTDILLMWEGKAAFIGECKIWKGKAALNQAVDQLFSYATWRDVRVALILFMNPSRMTANQKIADETIRAHSGFLRSEDAGVYVVRHPQDSARRMTLTVLTFAAIVGETT
jgi:uncharacterized protein YaeQ